MLWLVATVIQHWNLFWFSSSLHLVESMENISCCWPFANHWLAAWYASQAHTGQFLMFAGHFKSLCSHWAKGLIFLKGHCCGQQTFFNRIQAYICRHTPSLRRRMASNMCRTRAASHAHAQPCVLGCVFGAILRFYEASDEKWSVKTTFKALQKETSQCTRFETFKATILGAQKLQDDRLNEQGFLPGKMRAKFKGTSNPVPEWQFPINVIVMSCYSLYVFMFFNLFWIRGLQNLIAKIL